MSGLLDKPSLFALTLKRSILFLGGLAGGGRGGNKEEYIMEEVMAVQESYLKSVTCWP